jgi:hypothetical protein
MKVSVLWTFALLVEMCTTLAVSPSSSPLPADKPAFVFRSAGYWHRWSNNDQHEFTPRGQDDLQKWSDMVTINLYPDARDGDALATTANAVLGNYKNHQAMVLKTDSVPRTPDRPAEHYIAVVFGQLHFIEAAFARFKLVEGGTGCSIVYSHRIYGEKVGDQMSTWLKANGPAIEKALMSWNDVPVPVPTSRRTALTSALP